MQKNQKVQAPSKTLEVQRDSNGKIWSHIRQKWYLETPEERVRQEYVCALVNEYEYSLEQMEEEMSPPSARGTSMLPTNGFVKTGSFITLPVHQSVPSALSPMSRKMPSPALNTKSGASATDC